MGYGSQLLSFVICSRCGKPTKNKVHYCDDCVPFYLENKKKGWKRYEQEQRSKNGGKRVYDTSFWKKLRKQTLNRDNWLCCECARNGKVKPATEVDHIIPLSKGGTNDLSNLQSLCHECHTAKTHSDNKE